MVFDFACVVTVDPGISKHQILVILGPHICIFNPIKGFFIDIKLCKLQKRIQSNKDLRYVWIQKFLQNKTSTIFASTEAMKILIPETCRTIL